ncbi:alpha/beta fold hydrolase [Psychroflexus gondwanensis]|uniref:alpha/beta hydrolase family protein n=1 Tax=Psychroflexus gondwanensis TaxID=251 RepID=UPI0011BFABC1|nr:alpha/beta fold hydrolase [Psychroflexus gondwanensis]TXE18745.1 alpha/beta fold hydrolase [Psychroflexus gondwanensis]
MKTFYTFLLTIVLSSVVLSQDITGDWQGELKFQGNALGINFHINKTENGFASTMDVPLQGVEGYKSDATTYIDSLLTIQIKELGIQYQGKLALKDTIVGNFSQNGMSFKLNLKRGNNLPNRPQEPKPPYDYVIKEVSYKSTTDDVVLAGTLSLPKGDGPFPAVMLLSGSGPQDRNSSIFGHKPFLLLAHELTQSGIAVLRFDERGVGESGGRTSEMTMATQMGDAQAGINYLLSNNQINRTKIGLLGHSLGGILAPKLAIENDIDFLVLLAAPGVNGDAMMLKQRKDLLKLRGATDKQIEGTNGMLASLYSELRKSSLEDEALKTELQKKLAIKYETTLPVKELNEMVNSIVDNEELMAILKSSPANYFQKVSCPVLALNGSKDFQVSAKENLAAIEKALSDGGNTAIETHELEGLNHLFQDSDTGDISEYQVIEQTMSPEVLRLITEWVSNIVN